MNVPISNFFAQFNKYIEIVVHERVAITLTRYGKPLVDITPCKRRLPREDRPRNLRKYDDILPKSKKRRPCQRCGYRAKRLFEVEELAVCRDCKDVMEDLLEEDDV